MSLQQLHCFLFCSFLSIERSLQVTLLISAVPAMKGASCMTVLQESQRHKDQGWNASSINSNLFPACSDQQDMKLLVSTGMVPLPRLDSDAYCSTFCMAGAITSPLSPWHFLSSLLSNAWHFAVILTNTPSPSFRYQELLSDDHIDLQSWVAKRPELCSHFLGPPP